MKRSPKQRGTEAEVMARNFLADDVLAWADGWDSATASDQAEDYYRSAAEALLHVQTRAGAA